jgi:DNA polymerase-3 subunit gamma/tau
MYQALYRKWRPKTFDEVVGQKHITDTLRSEISSGRLSHAYLFTGTRGTGKTTCAKILSRAVNCLSPSAGEPCNVCEACVGIENGSILDVIELDAASNNGVDQVRALRDEAVYTPASVKKRVYIIDEVHMLTTAAFNALLKIMEEPPEHLIFILATTEAHKVPATILSRCQRFAFKRVSAEEISARLRFVAAQEEIKLSEEAAILLARLSDGSVRDGLSLLDQCASGAGGALIDLKMALDILGLAGMESSLELLTYIAHRDAASALDFFGSLYEAGKDALSVLDELSSLLREMMYMLVADKETPQSESLRPLLEYFPVSRVVFCIDRISSVRERAQRRLDAETCLLTLCDETLSLEPESINVRLARLEKHIIPSISVPPRINTQAEPEKKANSTDMNDYAPLPGALAGPLWERMLDVLRGNLNPAEYSVISDPSKVTVSVLEGGIALNCKEAFSLRVINRQHVKDAVAAVYKSITGGDGRIVIK